MSEIMKLILSLMTMFSCATQFCAASPGQHQIECPPEFPSTALALGTTTDWTAYALGGARLHSAEPMLGPPESMAFLKPSKTQIRKDGSIDSWLELAGPAPNGKWIACRYGSTGEFILAKKVDDATSACTVKQKRGRVEVTCTW